MEWVWRTASHLSSRISNLGNGSLGSIWTFWLSIFTHFSNSTSVHIWERLFNELPKMFMLSSFFWIEWSISSMISQLIPAPLDAVKPDGTDCTSGWFGSEGLCWEIQSKTLIISTRTLFWHVLVLCATCWFCVQCCHVIVHLDADVHAVHPHQSHCFRKHLSSN